MNSSCLAAGTSLNWTSFGLQIISANACVHGQVQTSAMRARSVSVETRSCTVMLWVSPCLHSSLLWDCPSEVTFRATPPGMDLPFSSVVDPWQPSSFPFQELDAFQPYPAEIMPGKIFLGKFSQACDAKIHKDLKIKAHVNVSMEATP